MEDRQLRLQERTFEEVRDLVAAGAWAFLPVGSVEPHGPHLPLVADVTIADAAAVSAARALAYDRTAALVLPPITFGVSERTRGLTGAISLQPETLTSLVVDVLAGAALAGFLGVVICNTQLDPGHRQALRRAEQAALKRGLLVSFPDVTEEPHAGRVDRGFHAGECHAGRVESSALLVADPFVVREDRLHGLRPSMPLSDAAPPRVRSLREIGGPLLYVGDPANASSAEGAKVLEQLSAVFADAARSLRETSGAGGGGSAPPR